LKGVRCANLIDGRWIEPNGGPALPVRDAATGQVIASVPAVGRDGAKAAVDAAAAAFPCWAATSATKRADLLRRCAARLRSQRERLADIITAEGGKPLAESAGEVDYSADYFDSAGEEALLLSTEALPPRRQGRVQSAVPEPIGVVAAVTPWNFPLAMLARKTAPALAAGCTQVAKPAEETPLSALALAEILVEEGLPSGVVNVITGEPAPIVNAWLADGRVRKLSFTGSTEVGRLLMQGAAEQVVRLSLELGGHAPFLVFGDADISAAVDAAILGKFRVAGQTCICPNRFIVHSSVAEEFSARLTGAAARLLVGMGRTPGVRIGPLISDDAVARVRAQVKDATDRGARIMTGGSTVPIPHCVDRFFAPTVIAGATPSMRCFQEETFGPIAPIAAASDEESMIRLANATPFGLAGYAFSADQDRVAWAAKSLQCGIVGCNTTAVSDAYAPFGGRGWSGFGREGGRWGIDEYISWKYICEARSDGLASR
jgi:succinate-semialdehyde dehydrogenase/glutarate-semialdehyde dehydrogenase